MFSSIEDQVVDFYEKLFDRIFSEPFRARITRRLKSREVIRQVEASADAASQSLGRFFLNQQLTEQQVTNILEGFARLGDLIKLEDIANPNVTPEELVENLLPKLSCPEVVQQAEHTAMYRVALHSIIQVLILVGPVMTEWQKLNFSSTFELPRRVVNRLNQISEQMDTLGRSGQTAADERYELIYRDYLLQRFRRIEANTVRMTTNMDVDLRELFVMPQIKETPLKKNTGSDERIDIVALMDLAAARKSFAKGEKRGKVSENKEYEKEIPALEQIKHSPRIVIIGTPGVGKSTFFEWLQIKLASVEEELVMGKQQAIPLLLRVRQLDPENLPHGTALIEKATNSKNLADLMPRGWIERQMKAGRILFMLDGLDETEPELRDRYVIPWLLELYRSYPDCRYLISSRPAGYPLGILREFKFVECEFLDFNKQQICEYTRNWCTAVRLARNELEEEARREGAADGEKIVKGFSDHLYIFNLARNPLMLSAICLVNYFEGGKLPEDRSLLYKLCVEGLLHNWDLRRGIHSEYTFEEKLRACREVALFMQANDQAECEGQKVQEIFTSVLSNPTHAKKLLKHIHYRTGLLLERRPNIYAFAHLIFQEYLAARAVHEGNQLGVSAEQLSEEHDDGRWKELIALYCGLAPTQAARDMIEDLIVQPNTPSLSRVLVEAYLSVRAKLGQDCHFRQRVLERISVAPGSKQLSRFSDHEVSLIANQNIGKIKENSMRELSEAFAWLVNHPEHLNIDLLAQKLKDWRRMNPFQISELIYLIHRYGPDTLLTEIASDKEMYEYSGPGFYESQNNAALAGLSRRDIEKSLISKGFESALLTTLRMIVNSPTINLLDVNFLVRKLRKNKWFPLNGSNKQEFASLARQLSECLMELPGLRLGRYIAVENLNAWAAELDGENLSNQNSNVEGGR